MNRDLSRYFVMVESADIRPVASARNAAHESCLELQKRLELWQKLNDENIPALNKELETIHLASLPVASGEKVLLNCEQ